MLSWIILDLLHDGAKRAVGQVLGSDVGERGASRHVVEGNLAAPDHLAGTEDNARAPSFMRELYNRLVTALLRHRRSSRAPRRRTWSLLSREVARIDRSLFQRRLLGVSAPDEGLHEAVPCHAGLRPKPAVIAAGPDSLRKPGMVFRV